MAKTHVWITQLNNLWNSQKKKRLFTLHNTAINLAKAPTLLRQLDNYYKVSINQFRHYSFKKQGEKFGQKGHSNYKHDIYNFVTHTYTEYIYVCMCVYIYIMHMKLIYVLDTCKQ